MLVSNSDNHKKSCELAEKSVLYLYDELDEAQKTEFSLHMKKCASCADELNAFSSIHSSIQNWKSGKFDVLSTPVIEIKKDLPRKSGEIVSVSGSWLANLRQKVSFSFGWVQAGAFAALLIGLAFGLYFLTFSEKRELTSEQAENKIITEVSPAINNKTTEIAGSDSKSRNEDNGAVPENENSTDSLANVRSGQKISRDQETVSTKISSSRKTNEIREKLPKQPMNRKNKAAEIYANVMPANNRNVPKLNNLPEEADEEDLRLADLFDEIDAG